MSNRRTPPPSPQGMGPLPLPTPRSAPPREQRRASSEGAARPPTDATAPRRGPAGWLRSAVETPSPEPHAARPPSSDAPVASGTDPTALAYQVLEQFIDEGRRSMQRWMRPVAATPPVDFSRLGGAANLEALGRLASDALSLLAGPATRPTRVATASLPISAPSPISAPRPNSASSPINTTQPIAAPPRTRGAETRPTEAPTLASTALAPAEQRKSEQPRRGSSEDRPVTMAPRAELRTNGTLLERTIPPVTQGLKPQPLAALERSWGEIVRMS